MHQELEKIPKNFTFSTWPSIKLRPLFSDRIEGFQCKKGNFKFAILLFVFAFSDPENKPIRKGVEAQLALVLILFDESFIILLSDLLYRF